MAGQFENQVAWITGGGTGIGKAMAVELAKRGADVAVSGRRAEPLEEVVAEVEALGRRGLALVCDVTDEEAVAEAVQTVVRELDRLDVAVANAGFGVVGRIEKLTAADWRRQMDVNVTGAAMTLKHALPELRKTNGRVALIGSVAGMVAIPGNGAYSASKFAVRAMGWALSIELYGSGVTCTTIHPGFVESDIAKTDNRGVFHADAKDRRPAKLMWTAERAAQKMVNAIYKRKREYTFTGHGKAGGFLGRHAPGLVTFVMTRFGGAAKARELMKENA